MKKTFLANWPEYLMEAWGLGIFMVSAVLFTILFEHPDMSLHQLIETPWVRRLCIGIAMGLTAIGIMYSPWGKRSGAHLNPAVTLAFYRLGKIDGRQSIYYILFQFIGGYLGVAIFQVLLSDWSSIPQVRYAVTVPGSWGIAGAFLLEALLSFILLIVVLFASNRKQIMRFTPVFAGILLTLFILLEAPYSGMSINPARTVASAIPAWVWASSWIYFIAPPVGMLIASEVFLYIKKYSPGQIPCPTDPTATCTSKRCVYMCHCHT